jgi:hypothetical protein
MPRFYTDDEFEGQVAELLDEGIDEARARFVVAQREDQDEAEYQEWLETETLLARDIDINFEENDYA